MMDVVKTCAHEKRISESNNNDATPIFDLIMSPLHGCTLAVFGRLGLFDYISSKGTAGVSVEDIANRAKWSIRATSAMMISLVTNGILCVVSEAGEISSSSSSSSSNDAGTHSFRHQYKLTPRAEIFLCSKTPGCVNPYLELFWECSPQLLLEKASADKDQHNLMLETGGGAPSELFINAMQGQTSHAAMTLSPLLNLTNLAHFVDVGGGSGVFCLEVCKASPQMKGSIYELKSVCPIAEKYILKANMADRVQAVPGNMFEDLSFPASDCYGFGNVLHDWSDDTNKALLMKAFHSLPADKGGKVVILEMLVAEDVVSSSKAAAGLNLVMVTNEDGRQYKASELEIMLKDVGFVDVEVVSSPLTPYSAVLASKPTLDPLH